MNYFGEFRKMPVTLDENGQVHYTVQLFDTESGEASKFSFNEHIGSTISIDYGGNIFCTKCGRKTNKSFGQGFCYPCFRNAPEAAECIIRPELCRAHLGEGRDPEWEEKHHNQPHLVYLAANDVIKVGVTRITQIPTRWIDQGAKSAIILAETPNRYLAGVLEIALKEKFTDKTNWRKMLQNNIDEEIDLVAAKIALKDTLTEDIAQYITDGDQPTHIHYPVLEYPKKIKSINLEKTPNVSGQLMGIKGQYILLDNDRVMNIRKYTGYQVEITL